MSWQGSAPKPCTKASLFYPHLQRAVPDSDAWLFSWRGFMVLEADPLNCLLYMLYFRDAKKRRGGGESQELMARWINKGKIKVREKTKIKKAKKHCYIFDSLSNWLSIFSSIIYTTLIIETTILAEECMFPFSWPQVNKRLNIKGATVLKKETI